MTAKEWLNRGYFIEREIEKLQEERERAYNALFAVQKYSGVKVQTSRTNKTQELQNKLIEYDEELNSRIDHLYDVKQEILNVIGKVENNSQRELLLARYISFHKWEKIAAALHYDVRHVYRLHQKALKAAEKYIEFH